MAVDEFDAGHGGTEQHLLFLCHHLPRVGIPTHLALLTGSRQADAAIFPIQPEVLGQGNNGPLPRRFGGRIRSLARLISREGIDIVYAFCPVSELAAVLATRLVGRGRVVGCQRNTGYWHSAATLWRARLARRFVGHVVANCQAAARFAIESEWVPPDRVSVIPNPINFERLKHGERNPVRRQQVGIRPGEKVVGIVANVRPVKDYDTFFQAARLVLDRHPATRFLVVGDYLAAYRERLLQTVASLGISNQVAWLGVVENPYQVLPHFDVGVLSSRSEGFSNALLEYASAGVPAVATAVGGSPELVIDGHTGFLVPPGDPPAMAARINLLLDQPELARTLGRQAKEQAFARCGQENILAQYQALFSRLLGREGCAKKH
ncbi:MAG: glycosyltransferase [Candidatus Oleimicrobiaceae bacterium]